LTRGRGSCFLKRDFVPLNALIYFKIKKGLLISSVWQGVRKEEPFRTVFNIVEEKRGFDWLKEEYI
jgi:hypothetical protein